MSCAPDRLPNHHVRRKAQRIGQGDDARSCVASRRAAPSVWRVSRKGNATATAQLKKSNSQTNLPLAVAVRFDVAHCDFKFEVTICDFKFFRRVVAHCDHLLAALEKACNLKTAHRRQKVKIARMLTPSLPAKQK